MTWKEVDKNTVVLKFFGNVGYYYKNAEYFSTIFEELDAKYKKIIIRVHSYGGSVFEGNVIYNCILQANAEVEIDIVGVSASMMTICMLAGAHIKMADNGYLMLHSPSGYTEGNAKDHQAAANLLVKMERNFLKRYTEKTGRDASDIQEFFDGADHWLSAEEALALGLIDEVVAATVKNPKSLDEPESGTDSVTVYNRYTSLVKEVKAHSTSIQKTDIMNKEQLIEKFQLEGVTKDSSDTAIMDALDKKMKASAPAASGNPAKETAEAVLKGIESSTGKEFAASDRATLLGVGEKSGVDSMVAVIGMMKPGKEDAAGDEEKDPQALATMVNGGKANPGGKEDRKDWTYDMWNEKDPAGLERMENEDFARFSAIYEQAFGVKPSK